MADVKSPEEQFKRQRLSRVPLDTIEAAIADALSELAGTPFEASLRKFDVEPGLEASLADEYEIVVRLRHRPVSHPSSGKPDSDLSEAPISGPAATDKTLTSITGRQLNQEWGVGARHALYHHEGRWYHQLRYFPGSLFDYNGYVLFASQEDFKTSPFLNIVQDVHVPRSISAMPGYIRRR